MNVLTAPLALLFEPPSGGFMSNLAPGGGGEPPSIAVLFLKIGTGLTLLMMTFGGYLLLGGHVSGGLEATIKDIGIKTGSAGIALFVLGGLFYLGIGLVILKKAGD